MHWSKARMTSLVYPIVACVALVSATLFAGCGGGGGGGNNSTTSTPTPGTNRSATVNVVGMSFGNPMTVASGTSVTWVNQSGAPHNVIWDSRSPSNSPDPGANIATFAGGATSSAWVAPTVTTSTEYDYHCGIHGPMMSGKITVTP